MSSDADAGRLKAGQHRWAEAERAADGFSVCCLSCDDQRVLPALLEVQVKKQKKRKTGRGHLRASRSSLRCRLVRPQILACLPLGTLVTSLERWLRLQEPWLSTMWCFCGVGLLDDYFMEGI